MHENEGKMDENQDKPADKPAASMKAMEIAVAALLLIFGTVVMWDSRRLGASWAEDGPQAGYFPFYIGLIIVIGCAINLWFAFRLKGDDNPPFVMQGQLKMVLAVMIPTTIYVVLIAGIGPIKGLGIYVSSVLFIAWFMRTLGKYSWLKIAPVSIGVSVAFFMLFEVWFKVPLPKGPLEAMLGFQ
jgi:putative tricarboxylic transport membrane protein